MSYGSSIDISRILKRDGVFASKLLVNGVLILTIIFMPLAFVGVRIGTDLFELIFAAGAMLLVLMGPWGKRETAIAALIAIYIGTSLVYALIVRHANVIDFLIAYKFLWYLFFIVLVHHQRRFTEEDFKKLSRFLLYTFLLIYVVKRVALHDPRPIVFDENNFELMLVEIIFFANAILNGGAKVKEVCCLLFLVAISGSRSASAIAIVIVAFSINLHKLRKRDLAILILMMIGVMLAAAVFAERSAGGVQKIDRVVFFEQFLISIKDWGVVEYLFGAPRISTLPLSVCSRLNFYHTLFSKSGNGSCYSEILHAFDLRIIYDHGLVISFMTLGIVWRILNKWPKRVKICVVSVLIMTGMSVSSLNNVYVALPLLMMSAFQPRESIGQG